MHVSCRQSSDNLSVPGVTPETDCDPVSAAEFYVSEAISG